jgi:hypothetical protein
MDIPQDFLFQLISFIFFVLTVYFANALINAKRIAGKVSIVLKETAETMDLIAEATKDNNLTSVELSTIALQAQENLNVAKDLINEIKGLAKVTSPQ